jgi:hypothetical protein
VVLVDLLGGGVLRQPDEGVFESPVEHDVLLDPDLDLRERTGTGVDGLVGAGRLRRGGTGESGHGERCRRRQNHRAEAIGSFHVHP